MERGWLTTAFAALALAILCARPVLVIQGDPTDHAEAAKLKNPVSATPESIAAGKALFLQRCQGCHGPDGKGGPVIGYAKVPPNLTDDKWEHGGTDGELFDTIKNGVPPDYDMEPWGDRIPDSDIWNLVNFVRSLHTK
jgi:mono/diheme cytochrome c family protein